MGGKKTLIKIAQLLRAIDRPCCDSGAHLEQHLGPQISRQMPCGSWCTPSAVRRSPAKRGCCSTIYQSTSLHLPSRRCGQYAAFQRELRRICHYGLFASCAIPIQYCGPSGERGNIWVITLKTTTQVRRVCIKKF